MFHTWLLELTEVEPINLLKEDYNDLTWGMINEALCVKLRIENGPDYLGFTHFFMSDSFFRRGEANVL